ncbi:MAG: Glycosyl transferase, family 2 [Microgenomates bacterium 39_6]|nr:MAG: Glycosyl transferase, family 2 [Microgenomates bacterium 39_6]
MVKKSKAVNLVSVIVPIFNQEKTIKKDLTRINEAMTATRFNYEIIAVIDGKEEDGSFSKAKKLNLPKLKVVGYQKNQGKGYAIRYGMARSRGDKIAFIDAGMDIDPNGISMILEHMEWYGADIIVGSKRHLASKVDYPLTREIMSRVYHRLVWLLFGFKVSDTQAGLKVFRREVLEKVLPRMLVKRFAFDVELLAIAKHLGFDRIYEAPIKLDRKRFEFSSTVAWNTAFEMVWNTLAVFYRLKILHYYDNSNWRAWPKDPKLKIN